MRRNLAWPYRLAGPRGFIADSGWRYTFPGQELHGNMVLGDYLPGWDYNREVHCRRDLKINSSTVRDDCGLTASGTDIRLCVFAMTAGSRQRSLVWQASLPEAGVQEFTMQFALGDASADGILAPGALSGNLRLETQLLLADRSEDRQPFTAHAAGSRLWVHEHNVILEGDRPRLPMIATAFSADFQLRHVAGTDFYVDLDGIQEFTDPFLHSFMIYVNSENEEFAAAVSEGTAEALNRIYGVLVSRLLLHVCLNLPEFPDALTQYESGAVGAVIQQLLPGIFPELTPGQVRGLAATRPSMFLGMIEAWHLRLVGAA